MENCVRQLGEQLILTHCRIVPHHIPSARPFVVVSIIYIQVYVFFNIGFSPVVAHKTLIIFLITKDTSFACSAFSPTRKPSFLPASPFVRFFNRILPLVLRIYIYTQTHECAYVYIYLLYIYTHTYLYIYII